ncbi:hypothetical protein BST61_g1970 [Cercospora zeina]
MELLIDRVFSFEKSPEAFEYLYSGRLGTAKSRIKRFDVSSQMSQSALTTKKFHSVSDNARMEPHIAAARCHGHGHLPNQESPEHPYFNIVTGYIEGTVDAAFKDLCKDDKELSAAEKARLQVNLKEVLRLISEQIREIRSIPDPGYLGGSRGAGAQRRIWCRSTQTCAAKIKT